MVCAADIEKHNSWAQQDQVYKFLAGLDDRLDIIRADVIQTIPLSSVEKAYARIRREEVRQKVMRGQGSNTSNPAVMVRKGAKTHDISLSLSRSDTKQGKKGETGCSYCHNPKHTKETCFKLRGYLEWWFELKEKKANSSMKWPTGYEHQIGLGETASAGQLEHPGGNRQQLNEPNSGHLISAATPQLASSHAGTTGRASLTLTS